MLQAMLYGAADLRLEERALDRVSLGADQVYVKTLVTAMSTGTELGNFEGRSTEVPGAPDYPRAIGYCNVGEVRQVGPDVDRLRPGQRVFALRPHQSAYIAQQTELLVPIPEDVSAEQASLAYLAQLGMAALRQAGYQTGENVAVVGLGVIGLGTIGLAKAMGAKVVGVANSPLRAEAALRAGAHAACLSNEIRGAADLQPVFSETGADIVILTANTWDAYRLSMEVVRCMGRVAVLGFPGRAQPAPDFNPLAPTWLYGKQLTLIGAGLSPRVECLPSEVRFNLRRNLEYIFDLMARGEVALESLITHRLPALRMQEAYELAQEHSKELIAAVFDWQDVE